MKFVLFVAVLCLAVIATQVESSRHSRRYNRRNNSTVTARPSVECPSIECPDQNGRCPYGPNKDSHGCTECGCRPSWRCGTREWCPNFCPNGFENGPDGCPTCRCYVAPTNPPPSVELYARTKSVNVTLTPAQLPASHIPSNHNHTRGYNHTGSWRRSYNGTHGSSHNHTRDHRRGETTCPPTCLMYCEHGFKRDRQGCSLCECEVGVVSVRSSECLRPRCAMFCVNGYLADSRGCLTCNCYIAGSGPSTPPSLQCPRLRCRNRCANGYAIDQQTGCQGCACRQA